jgi:predicted nucleic acid-binding protein
MNKIIISDTSCLIALGNIGLLRILKDLFKEIIITEEVKGEFGEQLPEWITVRKVNNINRQAEIALKLDQGEASSIALALELEDSILIIDELKGRTVALSYHLEIIGTIGVLLLADRNGLIEDFMGAVQLLIGKGFRVSDKLVDNLNKKYGKK